VVPALALVEFSDSLERPYLEMRYALEIFQSYWLALSTSVKRSASSAQAPALGVALTNDSLDDIS
jgi:hypothetical protein